MIKIFGIHFNRPDFVTLQSKTLKFFMKDDYEYIVVNNAIDEKTKKEISRAAEFSSSRCIEIQENINSQAASAYPGYHHSIAMNHVVSQEFKDHDDICVILDGDAFLIKNYSFSESMKNCQFFGAFLQQKGRYWLNPVVLGMKPKEIPDLNAVNLIGSHVYNENPEDKSKDISYYPKKINNMYVFDCPVCSGAVKNVEDYHIRLDTGGDLYMYLKSHPSVKVKRATTTSQITEEAINNFPELKKHGYTSEYHFEIYDGSFLHYCRSSNWDRKNYDFHQRKTKVLNDFLDAIISGETTLTSNYVLKDNEWSSWPEEAIKNHTL